jgi:hypothetical protein
MRLKTIRILAGVLAAGLSTSGCQTSDLSSTVTGSASIAVSAKSGHKTILSHIFKVNPDCSSSRIPDIFVSEAPKHGSVTIIRTNTSPSYKPGHALYKCNGRRISSAAAVYTSVPGYVGKDQVKVSARLNGNPVGYYNHYNIEIDVTK